MIVRILNGFTETVQLQHRADIDIVSLAAVDGQDLVLRSSCHATIDRDHSGVDCAGRCMRHIIQDRFDRPWNDAIADLHFFLGVDHAECRCLVRSLASAFQFQGTEVQRFIGDDLAGIRIPERIAGTENLERRSVAQISAYIGFITLTQIQMAILDRHDMRCSVQIIAFNDQRLRQERADGIG